MRQRRKKKKTSTSCDISLVASRFLHQSLYVCGALRDNRWSKRTNCHVIASDRASIVGIKVRQLGGTEQQGWAAKGAVGLGRMDGQEEPKLIYNSNWVFQVVDWTDSGGCEKRQKGHVCCCCTTEYRLLLHAHCKLQPVGFICPSDMRFGVNLWPRKCFFLIVSMHWTQCWTI